MFEEIVKRNLNNLILQYSESQKRELIKNGHYIHKTKKELNDTSVQNPAFYECFDLLITSPPYGDNRTTIPYGQYSYLPLQWIDFKDIDKKHKEIVWNRHIV